MRRLSALIAAAVTAMLFTSVSPAAPADAATTSAAGALNLLRVAADSTATYDRSYFTHWVDTDSDGCDARQEVLIIESVTPVVFGSGCTVTSGRWQSYFDAQTWTDPARVDIDHMVPLAEAWRSGADQWNAATRRAFANDLDFAPSLVAVTDSVNQSKSDRDPAQWMPPEVAGHCQYVAEWVLVKYRWNLAVDSTEKAKLQTELGGTCGATTVTLPTVVGPAVSTPTPPAAPAVYRFWSDTKQGHFYVMSVAERDFIMQNYPSWVWKYEGAAYGAFSSKVAGTVPLYRFWSDAYQGHFYTTSETEKDHVIRAYPDRVWKYERIAFYVYPTSPAVASTTPVARFWSNSKGHHFYTANPSEAAYVKANYPAHIWKYERDAFRVPSARPSAAPITNPGDIRNCTGFATYPEAYDWYAKFYAQFGDIARLDNDADGIPCESLPGAP